jgi:hypothetical protein
MKQRKRERDRKQQKDKKMANKQKDRQADQQNKEREACGHGLQVMCVSTHFSLFLSVKVIYGKIRKKDLSLTIFGLL